MPGGLPHPPLAVDQTSRLLHTQTPGGQPLLHHGGVQRVSEQEGHLLILLVGEVVGDGVVLPDNVLDGGLPDGPGPLPVGVVAASPDLAAPAPPTPKSAPLIRVKTRVTEKHAGSVMKHKYSAASRVF